MAHPTHWPYIRRREMKVICDKCGGEMMMSFVCKFHEDEAHIKFTCKICGYAEYLT